MKTLKLILVLLLINFAVQAQNPGKLTVSLKKGVTMLDSAKISEQYLAAAKYFEGLSSTEPKEWLPLYYSAYSNLVAGVTGKAANAEAKDAVYDKAMSYINKADALQPNNSEIYVLKGYITFMKMSVQPQARAMQMIPEAEGYLLKAKELNPENPRAYLLLGQNTFYTPQMFGGGKDLAKPLLTTAMQKFAKHTIKGAEPAWGQTRCAALLKQCN
jgi:tetratricopeptide (TPR) repeat protein